MYLYPKFPMTKKGETPTTTDGNRETRVIATFGWHPLKADLISYRADCGHLGFLVDVFEHFEPDDWTQVGVVNENEIEKWIALLRECQNHAQVIRMEERRSA